MSKILVINGPNLGSLGQRDPKIYGTETMESLVQLVRNMAPAPELDFFQSNHEGALIDRLELARQEFLRDEIVGVVLNAGAFTHTSLALADCLAWINIPFVEVHISNILARSTAGANSTDAMRGQSLFAQYSLGVIAGFGVYGYALAVEALMRYTNKKSLLEA